uniref:uncharacterized protein LOC122601203 n=1 Tax=Erigeron canadensis TaxID=72917 RepID=UPI001CB95101|nr:uncharacterized protein LOC122601203 [Erigeron canadensis]
MAPEPPPGSSSKPTTVSALDFGDPLYLHPTDTSGASIMSFKLTVKICTWVKFFSKIASEVWDDLKETYDKVDGSVTFNLHHKINTLSQNGSSLSEYYHKLNTFWKQFDAMVKLPVCTCKAAKEFKTHHDLIRLMQFLIGLDDVYMSVRSTILTRDPLPNVKYAYALLSREESHRNASSVNHVKPANFAFVSKFNDSKKKFVRNENLVCANPACGLKGHTIDKCFKLVGYPDFNKKKPYQNKSYTSNNVINERNNWNDKSDMNGQSSKTVISDTSVSYGFPFTNDQIARLMSLLDENQDSKGKTQANMAANQHMCASDKNMINVIDVSGLNLTVNHPNGTSAKITKIGDLKVTEHITLFDVLVVPEYNVSLFSVHKANRDSKLFVGFTEYACYIQDLRTMRSLGTGRVHGGLYLLNTGKIYANNMCLNSVTSCHVSAEMGHSRLGHPSHKVLDVLKDKLDITMVDQNALCDTCHKAKQTREPFPLSDHKTNNVGELIHLDVWGPYRKPSK